MYDPLAAAPDVPSKQQSVQPILDRYHRYLVNPPVEWTFMPLTAEYSPLFTQRHVDIANIFDNLHMLHDTISDILASETLPMWGEKRHEIYRTLDSYYLASAEQNNPMIVFENGQPEPAHRH